MSVKKTKWEKETLTRIVREFSTQEKYNILIKDYNDMSEKLNNYKNEIIKLTKLNNELKLEYEKLLEEIKK
jgi:hypothetical protein